jgi:hypothetical protein
MVQLSSIRKRRHSPAPANTECTISHGSQGCVISTTDLSDFALRDESTEEVLKTFNVRQESAQKHYQVLNGGTNNGNSGYSIKLDNQNPDYYNGIEYSIIANKNGGIVASFQIYTHYNPDYSELYVTSLSDGYEIVKYAGNEFKGNDPADQRNTNTSQAMLRFTVSPNPFLHTMNIQLSEPVSTPTTFQVINLQGQTVKKGVIPEDTLHYQLEAEDLPAGIYLLRLESAGNGLTQKLLKSN